MNWSLRGTQDKLDTAVRAAKEAAGEKITPPGLPLPADERALFVTEDCIQ